MWMAKRRRRRKLRHPILLTVVLSMILFSMVIIGIRLNQREKQEIYEGEERMYVSPFVYHSFDWSYLEMDGPFVSRELMFPHIRRRSTGIRFMTRASGLR